MNSGSNDFYELLVEQLGRQWQTVDIFSISSCFGFYSRGMQTFSKVLRAMGDSLTNTPAFRTSQMRLLVVPEDNPVDEFGLQRFHEYLKPRGLSIKGLPSPTQSSDWIQYAIFDDREALITRPQQGFRDEPLGIGINKLEATRRLFLDSDEAELRKLVSRYAHDWSTATYFKFPLIPTLTQLKERLSHFPAATLKDRTEAGVELALFYFLAQLCGAEYLHRQYEVGNNRLDIVIGNPADRSIGIELKLATGSESELRRLVGQVEDYRKVVQDLLIVLIGTMPDTKYRTLSDRYEDDPHIQILRLHW